jgi:hypothetical protein
MHCLRSVKKCGRRRSKSQCHYRRDNITCMETEVWHYFGTKCCFSWYRTGVSNWQPAGHMWLPMVSSGPIADTETKRSCTHITELPIVDSRFPGSRKKARGYSLPKLQLAYPYPEYWQFDRKFPTHLAAVVRWKTTEGGSHPFRYCSTVAKLLRTVKRHCNAGLHFLLPHTAMCFVKGKGKVVHVFNRVSTTPWKLYIRP